MKLQSRLIPIAWVSLTGLPFALNAAEPAKGTTRQIEEITVTAEKVESTVSDTSISITAFDSAMLEDFGLQGADEMINYIPATTRDEYDVRVRGVGRNFRALGGDPGVATYYNGIYSPDFGIAASENALYDLERVEVLRGPQGTLYGRNAVGGALNYVTKKPTMEPEGEVRTQFGDFDSREYYAMLSGPIIADTLAARATMVHRDRDGSQEGLGDAPDGNGIHDRNYTLALEWQVAENVSWYVRGNDRESDRDFSSPVFLDEGPIQLRGIRSNEIPVFGLTQRGVDPADTAFGPLPQDPFVTAATPGALGFVNPLTGETVYGVYNRPGLDPIAFPHSPNPAYLRDVSDLVPAGGDIDDPYDKIQTNLGPGRCDDYPYTDCDSDHEFFGHRSGSSELTWDINDKFSTKYLYGYQSFDYTYNQDIDFADSDFSKYRQTVIESVNSYSHELQLNWGVGERWTATTGLYFFHEERNQNYSLTNSTPRFTQAANYGALDTRVAFLNTCAGFATNGGCSITDLYFATAIPGEEGLRGQDAGHARLYSAPVGTSNFGRWEGDDRGDIYEHENKVRNEAYAAYTQGTYEINDAFQIVLGIRYARDDKEAAEVRGGYYEDALPWAMPFIGFIPGGIFPCAVSTGVFPCTAANGLTPTGAINITAGNATYSGDPANPLALNCPLTAAECATPLRLSAGLPGSYSSNVAGDHSWDDINYRVNLDWTPNDDILMYFSVTTGYRAGGYQLGVTDARDQSRDPETGLPVAGSDITPMDYDEETILSYEIGYKGFHFDKTLQVSAAIYQYDYEGYQDRVDAYDPIRSRAVDVVRNADAAINRGFEVELLWLPTDHLTLGGNYSYTDAFYDDDYFLIENDNPSYPLSLFGVPSPTNPNSTFLIHNVKDDQLKGIPEHKATFWASYDIPTSIGNINLRSSYAYTGEYSVSGIERDLDMLPDRYRIDVAAIWTDPSQRWNVRAFVDNVTEDDTIRGIGTGTEGSNWVLSATPLYPRYFGVDVRYAFLM